MKKEKLSIRFVNKTDERICLTCKTTESIAVKELFRIGSFYFLYTFSYRAQKKPTSTLREIDEKEFLQRSRELKQERPHRSIEKWSDGKYSYKLDCEPLKWEKEVPAADCIFLTEDNPLKEVYDSVVSEASMREAEEKAHIEDEKKAYARKCGALAHKYGVDYVNVMRLGADKGKIVQFQESYRRAIEKSRTLPLSEQRKIYSTLFEKDKNNKPIGGREARRQILDTLGVKYFDADVTLMVFPKWKQELAMRLEEYIQSSIKLARYNAVNLDYEERKQMYEDLTSSRRSNIRAALQLLGVDVAAININKYPLSNIRRALAATTLGLETEREG